MEAGGGSDLICGAWLCEPQQRCQSGCTQINHSVLQIIRCCGSQTRAPAWQSDACFKSNLGHYPGGAIFRIAFRARASSAPSLQVQPVSVQGLELGYGFRALAAVLVSVIIFGADFLAKHEVRGFHIANLKGLLGLRPRPTFLLPPVGFCAC